MLLPVCHLSKLQLQLNTFQGNKNIKSELVLSLRKTRPRRKKNQTKHTQMHTRKHTHAACSLRPVRYTPVRTHTLLWRHLGDSGYNFRQQQPKFNIIFQDRCEGEEEIDQRLFRGLMMERLERRNERKHTSSCNTRLWFDVYYVNTLFTLTSWIWWHYLEISWNPQDPRCRHFIILHLKAHCVGFSCI